MTAVRVGNTIFRDSYRTAVDGRTVIVSNGWTNIQTEIQKAPDHWLGVAACAAELPSMLQVSRVSPRDTGAALGLSPDPTGNAEFDQRFIVSAPPDSARQVLTPAVQEAMGMLQQLTPADRHQLAKSGTPLAAFGDVRSPQEARARFITLDQPRKMQLLAMFMQVKDSQRNT